MSAPGVLVALVPVGVSDPVVDLLPEHVARELTAVPMRFDANDREGAAPVRIYRPSEAVRRLLEVSGVGSVLPEADGVRFLLPAREQPIGMIGFACRPPVAADGERIDAAAQYSLSARSVPARPRPPRRA